MVSTIDPEFERLIAEAEAQPVDGWDFSWLGSRLATGPLPWDYDALVVSGASESPDLLDLGTGGGEWLGALSYRPPRTVATEAWEPNVDVAHARLGPLGVTVVQVQGAPDNAEQQPDEARGRLPFPDGSFHLVVSRHEAFVPSEVSRILFPGGRFITQQAGGNYDDFARLLGLSAAPQASSGFSLVDQVGAAGLRIDASAEAEWVTAFSDIGAFAWYLRAIPWTVPGFSVREYRSRLASLHARITADGPVSVRMPASYLEATRPPGGVPQT